MKVILKMDGTTSARGSALLMHNERLADPLDAFTREIAKISKKRNKTVADHKGIARLEFLGAVYTDPPMESSADWDNGHRIALPAWNVLRSLQDGATRHKRGKDVLRGVHPLDHYATVTFDGNTMTIKELWTRGENALRKSVGVQRSRTMRTRGLFPEWTAELAVEVDPTVFDVDTLSACFRDAGIYYGIGDMRPIYGRYTGTVDVVGPSSIDDTVRRDDKEPDA